MYKTLKKYFPVFVIPTLAAFAISFAVPFVMGVYLSFTEFKIVSESNWVGLANYIRIFTTDETFLYSLWLTVKFTVVSVITVNIIAFSIALLLTKGLKGTNIFRTVFFVPNLIGGIVLGHIWSLIINGVLGYFGVDITYNPDYGFWGLVVLMNWQLIGYMMIIYIAGIQNIPDNLNEAAAIDGASHFQTLIHVTVPMVMPSVTICTFLTLTNSFKLFDQNLALNGKAPESSLLALDIYKTFYDHTGLKLAQWHGMGQAKAVVFFLLVALIAYVQLRATRQKEVEH
ncbi:MAG: sugar ABC transporter permease [Clostridia bacterium]|nr:sugar ABC transporter permease [Clostridia bacterium]MBR3819746.1 sugar ABC transporter permease [Clostridia bacterium]